MTNLISKQEYLSKNRGIKTRKDQVEKRYPKRRRMKLKAPFSVIKDALSDIQVMHDFNYIIPPETREEFWKNECDLHSTNSTCKTYEV